MPSVWGTWQAGRAPARRDGPLLVCRAANGRHVAVRVDALGDVLSVPVTSLQPWQSPVDGAPLQLLSGTAGGRPAMLTVLDRSALLASVGDAGVVGACGMPAEAVSMTV